MSGEWSFDDSIFDDSPPAHGVVDEVLDERLRQLDEGFTPEYDDRRGGATYLAALAAQYLTRAIASRDRKRLVQAAAVVVAAIEAHDVERRPEDG